MMKLNYLTWIRLAIWLALGKTVIEKTLTIYLHAKMLAVIAAKFKESITDCEIFLTYFEIVFNILVFLKC